MSKLSVPGSEVGVVLVNMDDNMELWGEHVPTYDSDDEGHPADAVHQYLHAVPSLPH